MLTIGPVCPPARSMRTVGCAVNPSRCARRGFRGGLVFWDVHDPDKTVALDIDHEFYKRVIVEVEGSPEVAAAQIDAARERAGAGGA